MNKGGQLVHYRLDRNDIAQLEQFGSASATTDYQWSEGQMLPAFVIDTTGERCDLLVIAAPGNFVRENITRGDAAGSWTDEFAAKPDLVEVGGGATSERARTG